MSLSIVKSSFFLLEILKTALNMIGGGFIVTFQRINVRRTFTASDG